MPNDRQQTDSALILGNVGRPHEFAGADPAAIQLLRAHADRQLRRKLQSVSDAELLTTNSDFSDQTRRLANAIFGPLEG